MKKNLAADVWEHSQSSRIPLGGYQAVHRVRNTCVSERHASEFKLLS